MADKRVKLHFLIQKKKKNLHLNKKVEEKLDSEIKEATVSFEISIVEK